ncbi:hypothetical protein ACFQUU_26015 [Herbaspirillum sp. GCM10030257]|uniref:hypothetical protein n=1 Tax=Herbaspirillum sp. GCM10030257 TaxID=3273393 RepID=UPI003621523D
MSNFALYDHYCSGQSASSFTRQISIVLHANAQDVEDISRGIAKHLRQNAAPAKVVVFGFLHHVGVIEALLTAGSPFQERLRFSWGQAAPDGACFGIVRTGAPSAYQAVGNAKASPEELELEVSHAATMTAQCIFKMSGCLQEAPRGSHYSKTSKSHSLAFIRASNALIRSQHTLTIAYWLQSFVSQPARRILIDTSAIASAVYAACHLAINAGYISEMPVIDSFRSYEGLSDEDLEDVKNTLFVISASTSGNLACEAFSRGVKPDRLITLYLLANHLPEQQALCLLRKDEEKNPEGLPLIPGWKEGACALCDQGLAKIQIGGDLFLTSLPKTEEVSILKKHLPSSQRDIISRFAGLGVFKVHRRIGDRTCEMVIDLGPLLDPDVPGVPAVTEFQKDWDRLMRSNVAANASHLVFPAYPESDTLANSLYSYASELLRNESFTPTQGNQLVGAVKVPNGSAVVVAACVDDPVEMMGINRDLRNVIPGGTAAYFVPFLRARTEAEAKNVTTNLTYGDRGAGTYSLYKMYDVFLPEERLEDPWDIELKYLLKLSEWLDDENESIPLQILERRSSLRATTATGMSDALFWPDKNGRALQIRTNFVLLPTDDGRRTLTQADIFFVISALLNNLRNLEGSESLRVSQYEKHVLSPANFIKFNDGVIQAAILRAARDGELNFVAADSEQYSAQMRDILLKLIVSEVEDAREALTEFVLAIAVGRLRLEKAHRDEVMGLVIASQHSVPEIAFHMARAVLAGI